ncbi:MAG: glycogen/starch/alpha-glucan phosphorylase [Oscillospiraceae bacterium]|nr:glycogen/starch/alpha-glucan phosphorylase [Oscillospiraceae bacterium]
MNEFEQRILELLSLEGKTMETAATAPLYRAVSGAAMSFLREKWQAAPSGKRACYFSAEFLTGRLIYSNLLNMGRLEQCREILGRHGVDMGAFEEIEDAALGNGGLDRLAACFLDSAATLGLPLNGFGIRYRYGLFHQVFEDGFQKELADDWTRFGDPWSVRREDEAEIVSFGDQTVRAVPYDMPVIGYGGQTVNNLRLWQAEALSDFDFELFNAQQYDAAVAEKNRAERISAVLYPNDDTREGKTLRLKQQYFFSSASLQSVLRAYRREHGADLSDFAKNFAIQLNDTHPVCAVPELLRILMSEGCMTYDQAFPIVRDTFAYTNHTVMSEALERWDTSLFREVLPELYPYVVAVQNGLRRELKGRGVAGPCGYDIISAGQVHMARLAIYASHSTNGVARIHTEILKDSALKEWYSLYPERFHNKTNGITQRRWLLLCNPELSRLITGRIGDGWITDLDQLRRLEPYAGEAGTIREFMAVKAEKKRQLCSYIQKREGVLLDSEAVFDIQIKRLHEYKRQLLNAFSILDLYFTMKEGGLKDIRSVVCLFGAKAAPGYYRAKAIIKYINEVARLVNGDPEISGRLQVLFVQNYDVSYAEKLIPAADISEQISPAGTEASGTGNMKFMLNGAVTLGTLDGANVEIVEQSGRENNYIFGATIEEIRRVEGSYCAKDLYLGDARIRRVVDTLIDGTVSDGGTGMFRELYDALLAEASWHKPDHYYLLLDFIPYCKARLQAIRDCGDREAFAKKCLMNTAGAGKFSSDRTVRQYAEEIWKIG